MIKVVWQRVNCFLWRTSQWWGRAPEWIDTVLRFVYWISYSRWHSKFANIWLPLCWWVFSWRICKTPILNWFCNVKEGRGGWIYVWAAGLRLQSCTCMLLWEILAKTLRKPVFENIHRQQGKEIFKFWWPGSWQAGTWLESNVCLKKDLMKANAALEQMPAVAWNKKKT